MPQEIYAGFWVRTFAGIFDALFLMPAFVIFYYFGDLEKTFNLGNIASYLLGIAYATYFLSRQNGATLGKKIMKIFVARPSGEKLTTARSMARAGAAILTSLTFGLGFVIVIFNKEKVSLHDFLCDTRVFLKTK
jgi:uncharacterized RDD family membrane protein YckC